MARNYIPLLQVADCMPFQTKRIWFKRFNMKGHENWRANIQAVLPTQGVVDFKSFDEGMILEGQASFYFFPSIVCMPVNCGADKCHSQRIGVGFMECIGYRQDYMEMLDRSMRKVHAPLRQTTCLV